MDGFQKCEQLCNKRDARELIPRSDIQSKDVVDGSKADQLGRIVRVFDIQLASGQSRILDDQLEVIIRGTLEKSCLSCLCPLSDLLLARERVNRAKHDTCKNWVSRLHNVQPQTGNT